MNWEKNVIRRVMESADPYPGVMLQFLLTRLEAYPDAATAIVGAMDDMGAWFQQHTEELAAELARREAKTKLQEIVTNAQK